MTERPLTTHAPGCWSWDQRHYECAVEQIKMMAKALWDLEERKWRDAALLRTALEALESCDGYVGQLEVLVYSPDDTGQQHDARAKVQSAITAMRERLGVKA